MQENKSVLPDQIGEIHTLINTATKQLHELGRDFMPDTNSAKTLFHDEEKLRVAVAKFLSDYEKRGDWASKGYLTAQSALRHETKAALNSIRTELALGYMCNENEVVTKAVDDGSITYDHLKTFMKISEDRYKEHFDNSVSLLVENAKQLDSQHFGYVAKHWQNMVDALLDQNTDTFKVFKDRKLFLSKTINDIYVIQGELDATTGAILEKALNDIIDKIWQEQTPDVRSGETHAQRRADAIGYLASGYIMGEKAARSPIDSKAKEHKYAPKSFVSADLVIDFAEIKRNKNLNEFLEDCLKRETPIKHAHTKEFIEQILCDANVQAPIKNEDGTFTLGRTARTAPAKFKKQLALQHSTCFVKGCHVPHNWCDAHHVQHWVDGGETSLDNLVLLCRKHHTLIHNHADLEFEAIGLTDIANKPPPLEDTG